MNPVKNICDECSQSSLSPCTFSKKSNLIRHLKQVHNQTIVFERNVKSFKCLEGCEISFGFHRELICHLKEIHAMPIEVEELHFPTIEDFQLYINNLQDSLNVEYVQPRGKVSTRDAEVFYLYCNRSGKSRKTNSVPPRWIQKLQGSKKLNFDCISRIKVCRNKSDLSVLATYYKSHYGHDIELQHIKIPKSERINIAQKLTSGVSITRVVDDNRENFNENKLKRIDLLTRKDVHNIKTSFKIELRDGVRHAQDAVSVDMFVQECRMSETNPILFYKAQGEPHEALNWAADDFCLIIMNTSQQYMLTKFGNNIVAIDSTHVINSYDFELTTLLIIDEWGEGFPGACMITNRKDAGIFEFFFNELKRKIGCLNPKVFMSDITTVFYKGWKNVMGIVPSQLYCAWHIDRAWQSNLNKIQDLEKRKLVYHSLKTLQTTSSKEEFHKLLPSVLAELNEDKETKSFGYYFQNNYTSNYNQWAYSYRKNCGINTNMRLENMHKVLKYIYLDGKKVRRLDKGIYALNKFIRDKVVERIVKCVKGKNSSHLRNIHSRHVASLNCIFEIDLIKDEETSENIWILSTASESTYRVSRNFSKNNKCCQLICTFCNICIHSYCCTCPDFFIHNTICKHIHFLALKNKGEDGGTNDNTDLNYSDISKHLKTLAGDFNIIPKIKTHYVRIFHLKLLDYRKLLNRQKIRQF